MPDNQTTDLVERLRARTETGSDMKYDCGDEAADEIARLREALRRISRTAEMSAGIMRDTKRTGGWSGSEKVARQFERIAETAKGELTHE